MTGQNAEVDAPREAPAGGPGALRVCVVTNGSWFATVALDRLLARTASRHTYLVIVATGLRKESGNRLVEASRLLRRWGLRYFTYKMTVNVLPSVIGRVIPGDLSLERICRKLDVPTARFRNVNETEPMDRIRQFGPDLLVSFSCPNRLSTEVLAIPRIGSLNVHSSLLPAYAGMAGYVHALRNNDPFTGVTVHEMVDRLDAGRIVRQQRIAIRPKMSVFQLFRDQCLWGAALLEEAIDECATTGRIDGSPQDLGQRTWVGEPTQGDIRVLRRRGFRLMGFRDLVQLIRPPGPDLEIGVRS
jgi:methionyl-tRNA formyltransferase